MQMTRKFFKKVDIDQVQVLWERDRAIIKNDTFRLKDDEIEVCYDAAIEHYENVMQTVKSRGLVHELREGFDVLRERGFGRYDMTVAKYNEFEFLTSPNAAWMDIVHRCLGPNVERVHMGCFLSLPGSHHQIYHQDGVHLNDRIQKPCHAVNVFIPLVDLKMENGPTEFVLGTHILENDDYDRSKIETPTAPAGSPVIFDYRTGHRGMGNSTEEVRPILYITYSANGQFSDKVNFDQKCFHKLGEMVAKPKGRDERLKEREETVGKIWKDGRWITPEDLIKAGEEKKEETSQPIATKAAPTKNMQGVATVTASTTTTTASSAATSMVVETVIEPQPVLQPTVQPSIFQPPVFQPPVAMAFTPLATPSVDAALNL